MVAGSISLIGPFAAATRLPPKRMFGSSSSSTMIELYGANSENAGNSGGWGTMNDLTLPLPDVACHDTSVDWHAGHIGRGGNCVVPQAPHFWISSSPRAVPAQNGPVVGSSRSGNTHPDSISGPP
jgi:hypothetical protein